MADPVRPQELARDMNMVRLVRARRALRWRTRARYPAQRLLDYLQGVRVPAPEMERCRGRVELLRGLLARAGIHPDAPDAERQIRDRRRPDLLCVPAEIQREIRDLVARARPLSSGSSGADGEEVR